MSFDSYKITPVNYGFVDLYNSGKHVEKCGDFKYVKEFKVENVTRPGVNLSGIIIQAVKKYSEVTDVSGNVYNTTDAILNFTSGRVNYSCDSYFEIFDINANGQSIYADAFSNGALARYDADGPLIYDPTDPEYQTYTTQGGIQMNGRSFFIPENGQFFHAAYKFPWIFKDETKPANGLPFLAFNEGILNQLASYSQSNFLDHSVELFWRFDQQMPQPGQYQSNFTCVPNPNNPPIANTCLGHGGRKRKTKTKKNNKRKRRKTPRRH